MPLEGLCHNGSSCPLGCRRCDAHRSGSPTGEPGPTPPRTPSRPSTWPFGWARRASRATSGSPGTARRSSTTTAWCAGGPQAPIAELDRVDLPEHIPTLEELYAAVGTDLDISLDVKDPAAFDRTVEVAGRRRRRGARAGSGCATTAGSRSPPGGAVPRGAPRRLDLPRVHAGGAPSSGRPRWPARASTRSTSTTPSGPGGSPRSSTASRSCASAGTPSTTGSSTTSSMRRRRRLQRPRRPHGRRPSPTAAGGDRPSAAGAD